MKASVRIYADLEDLSRAARDELVRRAQDHLAEDGRFALALSGGSTPRRTYELLAEAQLDWARVLVAFVDERCVPPHHPESNHRLAWESLLSRVPLAPEHVLRIRGELAPEEAAARYAADLAAAFALAPGELPRFHALVLGLGADGHTASLFPGSTALEERTRLALAVAAPTSVEPAVPRVTLSPGVLEQAEAALYLVAGAAKAEAVRRALAGDDPSLPTARVRPAQGRVVWMLDRAAATRLEDPS